MNSNNHMIQRRLWQALTILFCWAAGLNTWAANLVQDFYLPMPEQQIYQANSAIISGTGSTISSTFSIVVTGDGTVIYYDQWEDGYETDLSNPTQPTTQIWGDGNDANGIPPGFAHDPNGLPAGTVITLTNNVSLPRNPSTLLWDARDHIAANRALVVTRAAWPSNPGPVFAGAVGVLSTMDYGTNYISPVGQDLTVNLFKYVGMFVMAAQNNTTVTIDPNGNGVGTTNIVLNQGESYLVNGGIKKGGRVTATKPVQADLIIGHVGAAYASDWFTLYPVESWDNSYYTPVGTAAGGNPAYVYVYNPNPGAITISYNTQAGAGSFTVPATNGVVQFQMPVKSSASFINTNGQNFFAICTVGANPSSDTAYNWGFTLVPKGALTTEADVGWGPGSADGTVDGSPAWVTPLANTRVYVDYKGDHSGPLTDPNGNHYDTNFDLLALQSKTIYDPSKNQTGMRVYTVDGTLITVAWGEDPDVAGPGNPYIDAGTTVLPFPTPVLKKSAVIVTDVAPAGISLGDVIQYTVEVDNKGLLPLGNTLVIDAPTTNLLYLTNSTTLDGNPLPDSPTGTAFPLDSPGYTIPVILSQGTSVFTYECKVVASGVISNSVNIGGTAIASMTTLTPPPNGGAACTVNFTDSSGTPVSLYSVGANIYVTMTNTAGNTSSSSVQTIPVTVQDATGGDVETILLTETGTNTGVFQNLIGLPTSSSSGLGQQDGILNVAPGDTLSVSYTDPNYGDSASNSVVIQIPAFTKQLYLSINGLTNGVQDLNRVDPVANGHTTTRSSVDIGTAGSGTVTVDATASGNTGAATNKTLTISHTTGSGQNRLMVVGIGFGSPANNTALGGVTNVTYGSTPLARLTRIADSSTRCQSEIWYLLNPPSGTANLVITMTNNTQQIIAGVTTFSGVNQATPFGPATTNQVGTAGPTRCTNVVTSAANELVYQLVSWDGNGTSYTITPGTGQTQLWNSSPSTNAVLSGASTKAGSTSSTNWWSINTARRFTCAAVSIKPAAGSSGPSTNVTTFVQTPVFSSAFTMPSNNLVTITNYITVTNGVMPASPAVTARLQYNGTNIITLTNAVYTAVNSNLVWSGVLTSNVTIPAGQVITCVISNGESGVAFHVDYDSINKPSKITLPATSIIHITSLAVYDAPYPGGNLVTTPVAGSPLYVRANVTDPFGSYDITSLGLAITAPSPDANVNATLNDASVVASDSGSKTYEYAWQTGPTTGNYNITATANEGTEGVSHSVGTSVSLIFLDLGTPSTTEFTSGNNGPATNGFGANATVYLRVTDLNRNTNSTTVDTVVATVISSAGDSELVTLTETSTNTGIFTGSLSTSTTSGAGANNSTLYAPVGSVLTASYSDPTDPTDNTSATATILPPPGVPGIVINTTTASPANGQVSLGQPVTFGLQVVNTGSTTLLNVSVTDNFPITSLGYQSASLAPNTVGAGVLAWTNLGSLTPGQSINFTVTFNTLATGTATNIAAVNGGTAANSSSATVLITHAALSVTKVLLSPTNTPVPVGSNAVFRITVQNMGNTAIPTLPLEDTYSGAYYQFVSSTITPDGVGSGNLIWTNLAGTPLAPNASVTMDVTMKVTGAGNPANNTATADFAVDSYGNPVTAASSTIGVVTAASQISGHVYNDKDQSGTLTAGDTPLSGVTIQLFTDPNGDGDPGDGTLVQIVTTDASGYYELLNLNVGNYVVVESDLPGYASTAPVNNRISVNLPTLSTNANNNFFDYQPSPTLYSTVSGTVWSDANQNGTNDIGETGIPNVSLDLVQDVNTNGLVDAGEPVVASVTTDTNGNYAFAGVTPGSYVIRETDLPGYYSTGDAQPPNDNQIGITVTNGAASTNNDFFDHLNQPPGANDSTAATTENVPVTLTPLSNASDPDGNTLTITNVAATNGVAGILNGTNVLFVPATNFVGTAGLSYTVSDGYGGTATANIAVTVTNIPPLANPDSYSVVENTTNVFNPLANDAAPTPGGTLSIIAVSPTNGTAAIVGTNISFTPAPDFIGTATIGYTITDGIGGNNMGLVTINVTLLNHPPTLDPIGNLTLNEAFGLQTVNLTGITPGPSNESSQTVTITAASDNTAVIPNPTVNYTNPATTGTLTFTPVTNTFGSATITVVAQDNGGTADGGVDAVTNVFTITEQELTNYWYPDSNLTVNVFDAAGGPGTGYSQTNYSGVMSVLATSTNPFTIDLTSFNGGSPGPAANFDSTSNYTWTIATTTRGVIGFETNKIIVDTSAFTNDLAGGYFTVVLSEDSNSVNLIYVGNHPPVANPVALGRAWGTSLKISISNLLANYTSDPDGDARRLLQAGASTNGSYLSTNSVFILFAPTNNLSESFTYVVGDTRNYRPGDTVYAATNWITVVVTNAAGYAQTISTIAGGGITVNFAGVPGYAYDVEQATNLSGPWVVVLTTNAPVNGLWIYTNTNPPMPAAFYRTVQHGN